ncbi:class I SAM-dependent methyltransferase [Tichowtungia aerotolerans]|uniref:Methyltransferase domain-containing protein n=1 Tax=Tichowtungia aerotolerans TaxID=2697043 RepID=A0A6P1M3K6_9BACT|nr:class I SAM-dependent methyltransferase [Tichowtungia aerotolerans]QHI69190.1 methyltransferase domain-containing protein [Tichowtungia aerotolerans]
MNQNIGQRETNFITLALHLLKIETAPMQFTGNTDQSSARYWNDLAGLYQKQTRISTSDFHYGPLLPGDSSLGLLPPVSQCSCLEIGCGAGQNSIFLAKQGAQCIAIDISEQQLDYGRKLAAKENVDVDFRCISMDALHAGAWKAASFGLIHSSYALPFSADPAKVITDCAALLKPGGTLLLTTGHPLYAGEWLDIGDGEDGVFLPDYFRLEPDVRMSMDDKTMNAAQYWPISQTVEWMHQAGLVIERLLEPAPMPIPEMSKKEIAEKIPYDSKDWHALYDQLARIPVVVIFKCRKA